VALTGQGRAADEDRPTPSGLPVPRYVSLKFDEVNARAGPGDEHRLLWVYHVRGLPVQVVAENSEWRRICDPDGGLSWVHKRTTDGHRMVMRTQAGTAPIRDHPRNDATITAYLAPRALAALDRCAKDWCKIHVGGASGWVQAAAVWGAADPPQCH
jgi:SH3-like domain-containing protein